MIDLKTRIRSVPDFPKPGILFYDIAPLLGDPWAFEQVITTFAERYREQRVGAILGTESRGFIFGAPLALKLSVPFVPVRKPGKLPFNTLSETYELEYGTDSLEVHVDAVKPGTPVVVVDDLLATGGTAAATVKLARQLGAEVIEAAFVIELEFLSGRTKIPDVDVFSQISY
jgi:adenine phosphoribosyltransferase